MKENTPEISRTNNNPSFWNLVKTKINFWTIIIALAVFVFIFFILYPLASIFKASFIGELSQEFGIENYIQFFMSGYFRTGLMNSILVAGVSTLGACFLGVPMAIVLTRYELPGKGLIRVLALLSLLSPPFIGAWAWILLLGRSGIITNFMQSFGINIPTIYGASGIILVYTLQYYPLVMTLTYGALQSVDNSLEQAAMNLGDSRLNVFRKITIPLVVPAISNGALLVFMTSISNFGTPMVIGAGFQVLPTLAYSMFISEMGGNPAMASTISMVLIFMALGVLLVQRNITSNRSYAISSYDPPQILPLKGFKKVIGYLFTYGTVTISIMPLIVVVYTSFLATKGPVFQDYFSLGNYKDVFFQVPGAIKNTFLFSVLAIILVVLFSSLIGYVLIRKDNFLTRILDSSLMVPYLIPGTVLGISYATAFNKPPIFLTGTSIIIVLAYFIRRMPYTIRSSTSAVQQMHSSLEDASVNLGVPPFKTFWKIVMPLILPGVFSGAILSWVMVVNELSSSIILYVGPTKTMPIATYAEITTGNYGPGAALASMLIFTTAISLLLSNVLMKNKSEIQL